MSKPDLPARLVGPGVLGNARWVVTETGIKMAEDLTARGVTLTNIARAGDGHGDLAPCPPPPA